MRKFHIFIAVSLAIPRICSALNLPITETPQYKFHKNNFRTYLIQSFSRNDHYFNQSGGWSRSVDSSTPGGYAQDYLTYTAQVGSFYSPTNWLRLGLDIPLIYREERQSKGGSTFGLGDVSMDTEVVIHRFKPSTTLLTTFINVKFATGDTSSFPPTGTGQADFSAGLRVRGSTSKSGIFAEAAYIYRYEDLAPYISPEIKPDLGNLKINFGNSLSLKGIVYMTITEKTGAFIGAFSIFTGNGSIWNVTESKDDPGKYNLSTMRMESGWMLGAGAGIWIKLKKNIRITGAVESPLIGDSLPQYPPAEGLIGPTYSLGVSLEGN